MKVLASYCASPGVSDRLMASRHIQGVDYPGVLPISQYIDWDESPVETYSLSAARNRCIQRAIDGGYDLLLLLDCDSVVQSFCPSDLLPDYGAAVVSNYNGVAAYQPSSWLALRRSVFSWARYHEGFDSLFWQDLDFANNVCGGVKKVALWYEFQCFHCSHPIATSNASVASKFADGERLYRERLLQRPDSWYPVDP